MKVPFSLTVLLMYSVSRMFYTHSLLALPLGYFSPNLHHSQNMRAVVLFALLPILASYAQTQARTTIVISHKSESRYFIRRTNNSDLPSDVVVNTVVESPSGMYTYSLSIK